jgi:NTE family protein
MIKHVKSGHRLGLVLGGGSSRGWSHIGVIHALHDMGIEPQIVCGCSIGAIVGAAYVAGNLRNLEGWVLSLTRRELARFFDITPALNGFIDTDRLQRFFEAHVCPQELLIENLDKRFATVATDLVTGKEIWFRRGPMLDAVWASMSLPGLFPPIQYDGHWLVDGGLVNPVPVSLCREMGADIVIAVNLNGDIVGRHFLETGGKHTAKTGMLATFSKSVRAYSANLFGITLEPDTDPTPGLFDAIAGSINITQDRITRSRMAGDPSDILLAPRLSRIGLLEFHRAAECIAEGRACVARMADEIRFVAGKQA